MINENLKDADLIARVYEYLILQFADEAGKKLRVLYSAEIS